MPDKPINRDDLIQRLDRGAPRLRDGAAAGAIKDAVLLRSAQAMDDASTYIKGVVDVEPDDPPVDPPPPTDPPPADPPPTVGWRRIALPDDLGYPLRVAPGDRQPHGTIAVAAHERLIGVNVRNTISTTGPGSFQNTTMLVGDAGEFLPLAAPLHSQGGQAEYFAFMPDGTLVKFSYADGDGETFRGGTRGAVYKPCHLLPGVVVGGMPMNVRPKFVVNRPGRVIMGGQVNPAGGSMGPTRIPTQRWVLCSYDDVGGAPSAESPPLLDDADALVGGGLIDDQLVLVQWRRVMIGSFFRALATYGYGDDWKASWAVLHDDRLYLALQRFEMREGSQAYGDYAGDVLLVLDARTLDMIHRGSLSVDWPSPARRSIVAGGGAVWGLLSDSSVLNLSELTDDNVFAPYYNPPPGVTFESIAVSDDLIVAGAMEETDGAGRYAIYVQNRTEPRP